MAHDNASWHLDLDRDCSDDERWEAAAAHIGVYLRWCFDRGWAGEEHTSDEEAAQAARDVVAGAITGTRFLLDFCDGKLWESDLTDEGNAFTRDCYNDYCSDVGPLIDGEALSVAEEKYDFERIKEMLDQQYEAWVADG